MKNFTQVNRALAAEKNFYINLNQIKSNTDGEPTVNRQSRLMSHRGNLRNLAMIFAILMMSVANIGMAWGATKTITFSGPTSTCSAGNNITLSATTNITESVTLSTGISFTNSGYALSATTGDNKSCTYSSTSYKIPQLYTTGGTKANWNLAGAISQYVDITLPAGSSFTLSSIAWALDAQSTAFTAYIGVSGGLISYKSTGLSVSNSTSASTGTLSSLNQSWVGGTTYRLYVETTGPSNTGKYFGICKLVLTGEYSAPVASEWQVKGLDDGTWAGFNMTGTGTVTCSRSLSANTEYTFKLYNTSTSKWWGNGTTYKMTQGQTIVQADAGANCKLRTSKAGTYTFSFNTSTKALTVTYPDDYKGYWTKNGASWSKVYAYCYNDGTWKNADWPGVEITSQTEDICGTHYYINTSGYTTVIFNNGGSGSGNQTENIAISGGEGKHAVGAAATAFEAFPTYTITFAANGGSSSMSNISSIACGSDQKITANGYGAPSGYQFAGWKANVAVTIDDETVSAGTIIADQATLQNISSDITLTAQWELIPTYDVTYHANLDGTSGSVSGLSDQDDGHIFNVANNGFSKSGYKFKWWHTAANGTSGVDYYQGEPDTIKSADIDLYAQWESVASDEEYWVGAPFSWTDGKITVGNMVITPERTEDVDLNGTLTAGTTSTIVNKQSGLTRHAKVMALKNSDKYLQIHFSDGKPINKLYLGSTTNNTDNKKVVVVYSATSDFTTAGGAAHEFVTVGGTSNTVTLSGYNQATKAVTDVSPSLENTYYYARIYKKITSANTVFDNTANLGDGATMRIYSIKAKKGATCTAPSTVTVAPTNANGYRYTPGETISLTCTASGGSGGDYSYQWQKYYDSDWHDIDDATSAVYSKANCTTSDGGSYRCIVSTGEGCETISDGGDGYKIRVWTFNGNYSGEDWIPNNITWTGANTGTVTLTLNANSTYKFKVYDNDEKYFGCNSGMTKDESNWTFYTHHGDASVSTGKVAGEYTFTIDITNVGSNNISVSVVYPKMRIYMSGGSTTWCNDDPVFFAHTYGGANNDVMMTAHSCEAGLFYADVPSYNTNVVFTRQKTGSTEIAWYGNANFLNKSDEITIGSYNKFTCTGWNTTPVPNQGSFSGSTYSPTTYTVSAAASPAGYGTVSAASVTGVACGTSISASSNTLTVGETNVTAAAASATAEYTYAFDNWTWTPAGATVTSDVTATANFTRTPKSYTLTWNLAGGKVTVAGTGAAVNATGTPNSEVAFGTAITAPTVTKTGYNFSAWSSSVASTMPAANTTYTATWTAKTTTITINANTSNHGSTTPGTVTATYGSALPSFTAAAGESGYSLTGYFTAATEGDKIINADGTLVASTDYADGSGNWKYETATLTLYAQYEEEGCSPTTASITFNNNVAGKFNTNWSASDITTSGGATYTLTNTSCDTGHKMTKQAIKGAKNSTLIQINIPAGATSGTISVSAATYDGGAATVAITNSSGTVLASKGLSSTTTNAGSDSWNAPTLKTASYNITSGGTYYIKETSNSNNIYIYAFSATAEVPCDETAPTFVSSVPANGATGVATSGTIVLTFSEAINSVDGTKFTLTGATKGAVAIDGSDATKVNIAYSGAANDATVTLATAAAAVSDLAGNALAAALSNISFTTAAAEPAGDCDELAVITATSTSALTATVGSVTYGSMTGGDGISIDGYSYSVKFNSSGHVDISPKAGETFAAGDSLIVVIYNHGSSAQTIGFKIGSNDYTASTAAHALHYFRQTLVAANISDGKVIINRSATNGSSGYIVAATIKRCGLLPSCTTPVLPTLTAKTVCEGGDADAAWNATITNSGSLVSGETVAYSWVKKGGSTPVSSVATYQPTDVTEAMAGTYVVTATVSADGKASKSASQEVDLTVTEGEEVTGITADKATVYPGNSVTLTATANVTPNSWQWYTCTSAEGAGAAIISGAESASYTIASADVAGTYYYKAVATGSCGTAEAVYTLVVSPAAGGDCETEIWVVKAADLPEGATAATHITTPFTGGSNESASITIDGNTYTITQRTSNATGPATIVVPEGNTATLYILVKGNSGRSVILEKGGVEQWTETPEDGWQALSVDNLAAGTYSLRSSNNLGWGLLALKLCSASACSDPEVTASADNTTACVGTSVTFTADHAHASATYQWQKLAGTWTNISGATASTYNIASVVAGDAGKYRVIASHDCNRTSNEVTLSVPTLPNFGSTVPASVSVMQTIALSINTVEATDAVKYRWYKSADATWDAGDVEIGTNKELIKAYDSEATGSPSYYIFCRAQNSCGITTSTAIAVNVTAYVEEDCATRGNEGDAEFSFENSGAGQGSYESTACWTMNSNSKILVYYPPTGKYFKTAKVTIASSSESKASYNWSTNGGTDYTAVRLNISTTLTERTIDLSAHGNVNAFQIGRNFNSTGESSGTLYVSKICFEYTDACTATTVTPSTSSKTYEMGGEWTNPTFTLTPAAVSGEALTYSSSNEDIASVDDDGTVTFNGDAGTVTITASYAGGTISETEYCASSGSYTINVSCPGGAPKIVPASSVDLSGCNASVTLNAKKQDGTAFADGTYQWFRNGEEIDGATSSSYTATQAGTYTVERTNTSDCTTPSTNSAIVTSETTEPEVERLVPFQYYHVDKTYSDQMKMRHLFAVKNSGKLDGKSFKMYVSRNGGAATDVTSSNALVVWPNGDGHVDTVMVDLNKLSGKYSENDELVYTCKAIDCSGNVSEVYKNTITMRVIGATPTLALICSGSSKAGGTRKTGELTVGGDFLTGYNVADLCQQTGNTSFDGNTEWGLYTDLKTQYIVTPVNGYAVFNKLNYEPFDILLLTDYPKASKSDAAKDVLDDMAALCDYRPMLSFKTHMVAKSPSKWAAKGFTTSPVVSKADGRLNLNIVCYAHPMFEGLKSGDDVYTDVGNTSAPLVYTMLSGTGYESSKGMQGFEIAAAENFVTIGLTHYNGTIAKNSPLTGEAEWTPGSEDRMLVTVAERQANPEARFILFSLNCGAQSKLTDKGEEVILACLNYLLGTAEGTIEPADCSFTFDNGENNEHNDAWYASNCPECHGTKGDGKWTTAANWGPDYRLLPGEFTSVRIKKPVEVNDEHAHVMDVRIIDEGRIDIPANKALDVKSTIRRMDGTEIYPTEISDIHIGSASTGNGTLIFNNDEGDTKARVDMYSKGFIDHTDPANEPKGVKNYQYMGTPFIEVNALYNYYGSWIYYWKADGSGWKAVKNGGPMTAWTGYCITQEEPTYHQMSGTLTATGTVDINVPADANMVVGNSWTAPIDINALTTDDLEGLTASIYFFNTGVDKKGEGTTTANATGDARWAGGTYVSVPIHSAPYTGDDHIPSLQGFFVKNEGGSAGTLHLDYERHVRKTTRDNILSGELHAPARRTALSSDEPVVLKMKVSGENYDDKLLLLEREDFTEGFDNGWDGDKWDGNESALYIYTTDSEGTENSVSAIPQLEGTIIGFRAGEDDAYTLHFEYLNSDEPLYLYDVENNTYTQIMTGMTYRFFTTDNEKHARFIITRSNGQEVATGVEPVSGSPDRSKAKKLLIENKMFIMVNGMLYDATGKVVK